MIKYEKKIDFKKIDFSKVFTGGSFTFTEPPSLIKRIKRLLKKRMRELFLFRIIRLQNKFVYFYIFGEKDRLRAFSFRFDSGTYTANLSLNGEDLKEYLKQSGYDK